MLSNILNNQNDQKKLFMIFKKNEYFLKNKKLLEKVAQI